MITAVIGINLALACLGFILAWKVWQLRQVLTVATAALSRWHEQTQTALPSQRQRLDPDEIARWRATHAQMRSQLRQLRELWALIQFIQPLGYAGMRHLQRHSRSQHERAESHNHYSPK